MMPLPAISEGFSRKFEQRKAGEHDEVFALDVEDRRGHIGSGDVEFAVGFSFSFGGTRRHCGGFEFWQAVGWGGDDAQQFESSQAPGFGGDGQLGAPRWPFLLQPATSRRLRSRLAALIPRYAGSRAVAAFGNSLVVSHHKRGAEEDRTEKIRVACRDSLDA